MTRVLDELPLVTDEERARIIAAPRTAQSHRGWMQSLPAMNALQTGGRASAQALPGDLTVVAWNLERCLFPTDSAAHLAPVAPDLVLLSEVDHGMARTAQRHTVEEMAAAMGMAYVYGVEFFELGLGGETERDFCTDGANARGWHGNAILSAAPFRDLRLIRLDDHGHWFTPDSGAADPGQPRIGGRMAIAAVIETARGPLCAVTTHLESNAAADHRARQFDILMDAADDFAPGLPVVIGGDLNTGNHLPPDFDWRREPLFDRATARGYSWDSTAPGVTTRPSLITPHPTRQMKLDWLATRGLRDLDRGLLPSVDGDGRPLSDHDAMWCRIGL